MRIKLFLILILSLFLFRGCSVIGFGLGVKYQMIKNEENEFSSQKLYTTKPPKNLVLVFENEKRLRCKYLGMDTLSVLSFSQNYEYTKNHLSKEIELPSYYDVISDTSDIVVLSISYKRNNFIIPFKIIKYIGFEPMTYAPLIGLGIGVILDYYLIYKPLRGFSVGG